MFSKLILLLNTTFFPNHLATQNIQLMSDTLIREFRAESVHAPVMVLFGGSPNRMNEVVTLIKNAGGITAVGAFSEEEGMQLLKSFPKIDLILIGGRYTEEQRNRIRAYVKQHLANAQITEPGYDYPYENSEIIKDIRKKLNLR